MTMIVIINSKNNHSKDNDHDNSKDDENKNKKTNENKNTNHDNSKHDTNKHTVMLISFLRGIHSYSTSSGSQGKPSGKNLQMGFQVSCRRMPRKIRHLIQVDELLQHI